MDDFCLLCGQLGYIIIEVRNYERHLQISDRFTHVRITSSSKLLSAGALPSTAYSQRGKLSD